MAHLAVGFLTIGMLALVLAGPDWFALLLVIPVGLSTGDRAIPDGRRP